MTATLWVRTAAAMLVSVLVVVVGSSPARGEPARSPGTPTQAPKATFALIIGSNVSVDADVPPLKYADDDAARYLDLFRLLGARTTLLTRVDDNTRRLHTQAAAEAQEPRRAVLERAMKQLAEDVAQARDRGVDTVAYVVFAGHGSVRDGVGYIALEDARITGAELAGMVAKIPATNVHVMVDACASYYLAYSRGPGGVRRPLHGFDVAPELATLPSVGLLLSTSSARESHEWDAFESGVFSHEVRSGLYGAADADGDGQVSYREIAAFVARANAAVPGDRYRPDVHARPPATGTDKLVDLRRGLTRRLDVDGAHAAHYYLEDTRGVRVADFHNSVGQPVHLVRPAPNGQVYLHRVDDNRELLVPAIPNAVSAADLFAEAPRVAARGAAHDSFNKLFELPFDREAVRDYAESEQETHPPLTNDELPWPKGYTLPPRPSAPKPAPPSEAGTRQDTPVTAEVQAQARAWRTRRRVAWAALGGGATAAGVGLACALAAAGTRYGVSPTEPQADVARRNERIGTYEAAAAAWLTVGGAVFATGAVLLLWPGAPGVRASATPSSASIGYGGSF